MATQAAGAEGGQRAKGVGGKHTQAHEPLAQPCGEARLARGHAQRRHALPRPRPAPSVRCSLILQHAILRARPLGFRRFCSVLSLRKTTLQYPCFIALPPAPSATCGACSI